MIRHIFAPCRHSDGQVMLSQLSVPDNRAIGRQCLNVFGMGERCWVGNGTLLRIRRAVGFPGDVPDNALGNRGRWILAGPRWPDLVLDILPQNSYADFCFIKHVARSSPEGVVGFSNG